ncbi:alpha-amylase family protein [Kribbella solani]|uniref:alpha-amylase family protein n=1 Tax=Kribbella solani TaxID=236067 RepID=UPI0029B542D7|nr:alpha-amylase family protein [Kribbella solani]MDX2970512.1 alpha-amylase family protein [Kribbella solani]MDX3003802.1 alpha-amylase family protein [Kribbella solani]
MWPDHAIWWQLYPLGFTGAEPAAAPSEVPTVVHRLPQLENWLDYAINLGCSGLLLGPVFAAETHGYDTIDHFRIDPRLGDDADFDHLIAGAHARGLRIALDGVFNHVARSFAHPEWFRRGADGLATFEGHEHLVALDHERPEVAQYVGDVLRFWNARGVDAWRLDAAYAVPPEFWRSVLPRDRDVWYFGEVIHGDYAAYVEKSGLDSVTQYELWKAIWSSLNDRNFFELSYALGRHNALLDTFVPQTFVGNHDVTRLATRLDDERHVGHALAILFLVGGVPSVYAGDEQAYRGLKEDRAGGDDAIRPGFPDTPAELAPYGWPTYRLHQELIGLRRRHPWLTRARTTVEQLTNETIALRSTHGDEWVLLLLNVSDRDQHFVLDRDQHSSRAEAPVVPAHGWKFLTSS